jgi:hypothetical protein
MNVPASEFSSGHLLSFWHSSSSMFVFIRQKNKWIETASRCRKATQTYRSVLRAASERIPEGRHRTALGLKRSRVLTEQSAVAVAGCHDYGFSRLSTFSPGGIGHDLRVHAPLCVIPLYVTSRDEATPQKSRINVLILKTKSRIANISFQNVAKFMRITVAYANCIHKEIKHTLNSGNACYHAVQNLLFSRLLSRNVKMKKSHFTCWFVWMWNSVSHLKRKTRTRGV